MIPFLDLKRINARHEAGIRAAIDRVLDSGWYILGDECNAFEAEFAAYCEARHCIGVANGLDALHLILRAYGIGEGDEVIVPAYSFVATALCIVSRGAIPVFVDVLEESGNIDPAKVEAAISKRTRAIMPVHVHGCPADLGPLLSIAKKHDLVLIEDAAQAHGATYDGKPVGTFGRGAGFSLQSSKNLSAGS